MVTVRHRNARAAGTFTASQLRKGNPVMLWDSDSGDILWATVPQRSDIDSIECGYRAGCWDDLDEYLWKYTS